MMYSTTIRIKENNDVRVTIYRDHYDPSFSMSFSGGINEVKAWIKQTYKSLTEAISQKKEHDARVGRLDNILEILNKEEK